MQAGKTSEAAVIAAAYGTLASAAGIGFYFCFVTGWVIALFMAIGGLAIRFYTSHFARWLLGEFLAGFRPFVRLNGFNRICLELLREIEERTVPFLGFHR